MSIRTGGQIIACKGTISTGGSSLTAGTGISISSNAININQVTTVSSNVTVTGTITDAFGVLSGFGANNYATIPTTFNPGTDSWELVIKCKTPATLPSRYAYLYGTPQGSNSIVVGQYSDGTMTLWLSSTGDSTWDICSDQRGTTALSTNTDYMVSVAFDGTSTYTLSLSTDGGTNWTTEVTVTSSSNVHSGTIDLGSAYDHDSATVWGGSIDLNSSGLKITLQGEVWSGMLTDTNIAKATANLYGLVKPDNSTITISDGVISAVGGGGSGTWGSITGTLSNQTDLQSALDAKQATLTAGTNVSITNNTISATDTTYTAGTDIDITNNQISFNGTIPTKTSDLTNDSNFITKSVNDLTNYTLSSDFGTMAFTDNVTNANISGTINQDKITNLTTDLAGKQATISDLADIRSNASAGKTASDTIATYGDIVTHNASEFATPSDIHNNTITFTQGGTTKGSFTLNQSTDTTIELDAGGSSGVTDVKVDNISVVTSGVANIDLTGKQDANLVTSISGTSTDTEYPSARCMYNMIGDLETLINNL